MNKKIENVEELEASSTHTNKFGSKGFALMLVFMVIAFSAFTQINKKAVSEVCFKYVGVDLPNVNEVIDEAEYEMIDNLTCLQLAQTLCGVCFDEDLIPLNGLAPNFADDFLSDILQTKGTDPGNDGQTFYDPDSDKWVTLHFRAKNSALK